MSKVFFLADTQLDSRPPSDKKDEEGRSIRFQENLEVIKAAITKGYEMGCRHFIHLGDAGEDTDADSMVMDGIAIMFRHAFDIGYEKISGAVGNHDTHLYNISSSNLAPFGRIHKDIHIYHEPQWEGPFFFLPYQHERSIEDLGEILAAAVRDHTVPKNPVLLAHYGYAGCTIGPKNLVLPGDLLGRAQIPSQFKLGLFGHIHKQQVIEDKGFTVVFPGSPVIIDHGERSDVKGFAVYDTETTKWELGQLAQPRRWIDAVWPIVIPAAATDPQPWLPTDIVRITGVREDDVNVKSQLVNAFKEGSLVEPFYFRDQTELKAVERPAKNEDVAKALDLRSAVMAYFGTAYPENDNTPAGVMDARRKALAMILDAIKESKPECYSSVVVPVSIKGTNWMSWPSLDYTYQQGVPVLLQAPNGIGKSNFGMEAPLFCLTGETSKGVVNAGLVRQGADKAELTMRLHGDRADFMINRTIKLNKTGGPTQKVKLTMKKHGSEEWRSLADGGVQDTQAILERVIGASYTSLRSTRFSFQGDLSPFIGAKPVDRKRVVMDIIGLNPVIAIYERFNKQRNILVKVLAETKASVAGMGEAFKADDITRLQALFDAALATLGKALADKALLDQTLAAAILQSISAKTFVTALETSLAAIPNTGAQVAALEQVLVSAGESRLASKTALEARLGAAGTRAASLDARKPQQALEAAQASLPALQIAVDTAVRAQDAAARAETEAGLSKAGLDGQVSAAKNGIVFLDAKYAETKVSLTTRFRTARDKVSGLVAASLGKPETVETEKAKTPGLVTASAEATAKVTAATAANTDATMTLATAISRLATIKSRIAELGTAETGNCSKCGQILNTDHIAKELAELGLSEADAIKYQAQALAGSQGANLNLTQLTIVEKVAIKAVADNVALIATLERDAVDLKTAGDDLAAVTAEGQALTTTHDERKVTATAELAVLTTQLDAAIAALTPFSTATTKAKLARGLADQDLTICQGTIVTLKQEVLDLAGAQQQMLDIAAELQTVETNYATKVTETNAALETKRAEAVVCDAKRLDLDTQLLAARETLAVAGKAEGAAQANVASQKAILDIAETGKVQYGAQLISLRETEAKLNGLLEKEALLAADTEVMDFAADALNPRTGLPMLLVDAKLGFLQNRVNAYMARLGSTRLSVKFDILDGDQGSLMVLIDNGKLPMLDAANYSWGQRDRIERATAFAMTELQEQAVDVRLGMSAMDEPGVFLDAVGKEALVAIVHEKTLSGESPVAVVISNDKQISAAFQTKIHLSEDEEGCTVFA